MWEQMISFSFTSFLRHAWFFFPKNLSTLSIHLAQDTQVTDEWWVNCVIASSGDVLRCSPEGAKSLEAEEYWWTNRSWGVGDGCEG